VNKCIPFKVGVVGLEAFHLATGRTETYTQRRVGHLVFSFGTTKPPTRSEDGSEVISRNVRKPHPDAAVCEKKILFKYIPCIYVTQMSIILFVKL